MLDVNPSPISFLDDTLLFVCLPAHFVFAFVNVMPAVFEPGNAHNAVQIVKNALMVSYNDDSHLCDMETFTYPALPVIIGSTVDRWCRCWCRRR